ncbi:M50 family metallopeptidase [Flavobacterium sp. 25HG05S-40]|uniref:M50 family metallopeptidase n=1 Tax=Flavobacterium sp. 25HG05S-40 TaxID=3458682 RepID=UPI0040446221
MKIKKTGVVKVIRSAALFLVCGLIGFYAGKMGVGASSGMSKLSLLVLVSLFIPLFFIVIAIHEAGHAWAGVRMNFDFKTYVIGPFLWQKEQNQWRFKWNKNINTAGGMVICMPQGTDNLGKRFSVYAAGGPIASLLLTLLAFGGYSFIEPSSTALEIFRNALYITAFLSLIIFIVTALPLRANGFSSDGGRVLRLLQGGATSRFELLLLKLITGASAGIRPRDIDSDELTEARVLASQLKAPFGVYLHGFSHQAEWDKGNVEKAEQHLLDYIQEIEAIPKGIRNIVWLDAAYFYAYAKKDLEQSEYYWNQFEPAALIPKAQIFATEAAIQLLKNDQEAAQQKIEASEKEIGNMLDQGLGVALKDKLTLMKKEAFEN